VLKWNYSQIILEAVVSEDKENEEICSNIEESLSDVNSTKPSFNESRMYEYDETERFMLESEMREVLVEQCQWDA